MVYTIVYKFAEAIQKDACDPNLPLKESQLLDESSDLDKVKGKEKELQNDSTSEISLSAFSGVCYKCGEQGHKAFRCPKKTSARQNHRNGDIKCTNCGNPSHSAQRCWFDEKNARL